MTTETVTPVDPVGSTLRRIRIVIAVAAVWGLFHLVMDRFVFIRGDMHPLVLISGPYGFGGALVVIPLTWLATWIAGVLGGALTSVDAMRFTAAGMALWAFGGATMDEWLMWARTGGAAVSSAPYWPLLADYVVLAVAMTGSAILSRRMAGHDAGQPWSASAAETLGLRDRPDQIRDGFLLLLIILGVASFLVPLLMGPAASQTRPLQVYFSVGVGLSLSLYLARRMISEAHVAAVWSAPLVLGIIGVIVAGLAPTLRVPAEFRAINSIPAWGLVRALPIEMTAMGIAAILWMVHPVSAAVPTAQSQARNDRDGTSNLAATPG